MAVEVHSISNSKGLRFVYSDVLRHEEYLQANGILIQNPAYAKARFCIVDALQVTKQIISKQEIYACAEHSKHRSDSTPKFIVAVLAGSNLSYGLARMWEVLADASNWSIKIFNQQDADSAYDWLQKEYQSLFGEPLDNFDLTEVLVPKIVLED